MSHKIAAPTCMYCKKSAIIELTDAEVSQYNRLQSGEITHIQDAFPEWTADQRELLITGTHSKCWDDIFGDEDE